VVKCSGVVYDIDFYQHAIFLKINTLTALQFSHLKLKQTNTLQMLLLP